MIRKMFKSQLKDEDYDLFFLVGFKRNSFNHDWTSQQLVNRDKQLMKEFGKFNDLGKISHNGFCVSKRYKITGPKGPASFDPIDRSVEGQATVQLSAI